MTLQGAVQPHDAARVAALGAIIDALVPPHRHAGLVVMLARHRAGLTQYQLGAAVGLSRAQITRLELGTTRISGARAAGLAAALDVPQSMITYPGELTT